ncbi:MAG TPA: hypothetical protein VKF16_05635 [Candidatus Dormibacteraeota bacterium]|nr:hypothetical protein [Candidatus Dormibacteraeota bacterium]
MDPYSSERWLLERHEAILREAELRARLLPSVDQVPGLNAWVAERLRGLADRLDGRGVQERLRPSA